MHNLRSESEIVASWRGDVNQPEVSIVCTAYNHEMYIEDAIVGFLLQETNFPFEVVIHDDASSDKTSEVIAGYAEKYPNIIKPILQNVNQFSRSGMQMLIDLINNCSGRYVAICEGDDYWVSPNKLQTQYDLMESDPSASICIHNAIRKNIYSNEENNFNSKRIPDRLTSFDVIRRGWFSPTASFFFRRFHIPVIPDGVNGDLYILFECSMLGDVRYIDKVFSLYRYGSEGSLSEVSSKSVLYERKNRFLKYAIRRRPVTALVAVVMLIRNKLASVVK